ncbi:hypothetical protein IMCC3317_17830 [Kordia antarctica]|uniref:JAB1/MPN/MOV34 metalloenzyme domain-containing protein n=1 Tax=Kordia antarctica TaxID=1218801 RepID=A0A7L4ZIR3_9FLAO|nr:Mov34/MPN/PAD-1 family protein [Kordia antarctica]QHI36420.1 hypothetical protein IMCC3317_17830 [Kordia antarctica]
MDEVEKSISEVKLFFDLHDRINYLEERKYKNKYIIDFEIDIKSYISENELEDHFAFELEISHTKAKVSYEIFVKKGPNIPFHPHFKTNNIPLVNQRVQWVDYKGEKGTIVAYVKRMILSLAYNRDFIKSEKGVNKKALNWYLKGFQSGNSEFPTDNFLNNPNQVANLVHKRDQKKFVLDSKNEQELVSGKKIKIKKKFDIVEDESFKLGKRTLEHYNFNIDEDIISQNEHLKSDSHFYITQKAREQIWNHISWGNHNTKNNKIEQGGILLGQVFFDEEREVQFGIVEEVVVGRNTNGSSVYLEMSHETWSQMLIDADKIIDDQEKGTIQIIGWYHTHPNGLDVFMSGTDMNTQQRFFNQDWHYAIVINPHKQIWKAFVGKEALECKGFILKDDKLNIPASAIQITKNNSKKKDLIILILTVLLMVTTLYGIFQMIQNGKVMKNRESSNKELNQENTGTSVFKCAYHLEEFQNNKTDSLKLESNIINQESTPIDFLEKNE